jgi:hypothetical protein
MTANAAPSAKRPGWVWAISIFMFISAAWTLLSFYLIGSGTVPLTPEQKAYFDSLSTLDYGAAILGGLLNLSGATALFLMRKAAVPLFGSAFVLNLLSTIWNIAAKNWTEAIGASGLIGAAVGMTILGAIVLYARSLAKRGVLT